MKQLYALLITTFFCSIPFINATQKPIILTDFDEVWVEKPYWLEALAHLQFLIKDNSNKPQQEKPLATTTLQLLDYGRKHPRLASYIPSLLRAIGKSRSIIEGTQKIYHYLKTKKGYTIIIATNRDRMSYDLTIKNIGNQIVPLVTKTFLYDAPSQPNAIAQLQAFANQPTTPVNYKNLVDKAIAVQSTDTIIHVPSAKPNASYFNFVVDSIGADQNIIFIDDILENVTSFRTLQDNTKALRHGIQFINPQQLAQELIKLGVLSEVDDKELLDELNRPGIIGSITSGITNAFTRLKAAVS